MNKDLLNILSDGVGKVDNQKLVDYLNGNLSDQDRQEVEELMAGSDFVNDAVEGLENIKDTRNIQAYLDQLNTELKRQLKKKKDRREKRRIKEQPWIYFTIIIILLLCLVGYFVIRQYYKL